MKVNVNCSLFLVMLRMFLLKKKNWSTSGSSNKKRKDVNEQPKKKR